MARDRRFDKLDDLGRDLGKAMKEVASILNSIEHVSNNLYEDIRDKMEDESDDIDEHPWVDVLESLGVVIYTVEEGLSYEDSKGLYQQFSRAIGSVEESVMHVIHPDDIN